MDVVLNNMNEVVAAMSKNNAEMSKHMAAEAEARAAEEKDTKIEDNVIAAPKISSSLTGDEKNRYQAIGKEMFAPILSSLERLIQNEKKKNDMTITNGGDEKSMDKEVKVQYNIKKKKNDKCDSWVDTLMDILGWIAIGAIMFGPKIEEFFTNAWEWIKDLFSSIASFFDFSEGPIAAILNIITGALKGLWKLVTAVFNGLVSVGSWVWDGIRNLFNKFITGPDGILNFGIKIVKGIVDFTKNAVSWIGDAIMNTILWPIKAIFGDAEDTGKKAGEEAAQDTSIQVNQAVHQQQLASKAVTDRAIMSQQETEASWRECVKASRAAAKERADKIGLRTNADGTISEDALKTRAAETMLEAFEAEQGSKFDEVEKQQLIAAMKKEMVYQNGRFDMNGAAMQKAIKTAAEKAGEGRVDSSALDNLQDMQTYQFNAMVGANNAMMTQALDIMGQANVKNEFDAKTAEEQFLYRMEEAKKRGTLAEFRIAEARAMIEKSITAIRETFGTFDTQLTDNFSAAFRIFVKEVRDSLRINVSPVEYFDSAQHLFENNVTNSNTIAYNIMPLSKEDFKMTSNELVSIAQENTTIIKNQNTVLSEIKELLVASGPNAMQGGNEIEAEQPSETPPSKESRSISEILHLHQGSLYASSSSWFD